MERGREGDGGDVEERGVREGDGEGSKKGRGETFGSRVSVT